MRKYNIYVKTALVVFAGFLAACSSDNDITENNSANPETPVSNNDTMTFSASMDAGNETRTDFNSNSTIWTEDDAIKIANFASVTGQDAASASGVYSIVKHGDGYTKDEVFYGAKIRSKGNNNDWFYAVYPSTCPIGHNGIGNNYAAIKGTVPAKQTAVKGAYDQTLHFMTAYSTNNTFAFKNVCALLKITLTNYSEVRKVRVESNTNIGDNTNYIAGDFEGVISTEGGAIKSCTMASTKSTSVELSLPVAGDDCSKGTFYMVVLPKDIMAGFTLFIEKADGTKYMRVNATLKKFERNKLYDLGEYNCSSTPTNMAVLENYVDLGLPSGTLWCTKNITGSGTSTTFVNGIYDFGGYYAWGELAEKAEYSSSTYTLGSDIYTTDSNPTLRFQYDAAYQIRGHLYCMPTKAQIEELYNNCSITNNTGSAISNPGLLLTSKKNGNTLWLPAAGYMCDEGTLSGLQSRGTKSHYWSKSLYSNSGAAYCLDFDGGSLDGHGWLADWVIGAGTWYDRRLCGKCIRPVVIFKELAQ